MTAQDCPRLIPSDEVRGSGHEYLGTWDSQDGILASGKNSWLEECGEG